jgi:hypothetical protein
LLAAVVAQLEPPDPPAADRASVASLGRTRQETAINGQLARYRGDAHSSSRGHYKAADGLEAWHGRIGAPAALLSAIVATSIFATLSGDPTLGWKLATGLVSLAAAGLASLQLFFNYSEKSAQHRASGAAYAALRRELELLIIRAGDQAGPQQSDRQELLGALDRMRLRFDELADSSPLIPDRAWQRATAEIEEQRKQGRDSR